jgi:hypothetical protein
MKCHYAIKNTGNKYSNHSENPDTIFAHRFSILATVHIGKGKQETRLLVLYIYIPDGQFTKKIMKMHLGNEGPSPVAMVTVKTAPDCANSIKV